VEAARIALRVMSEYDHAFDQIIACCFSAADAALYESTKTGAAIG
jgi:hypothetical protein